MTRMLPMASSGGTGVGDPADRGGEGIGHRRVLIGWRKFEHRVLRGHRRVAAGRQDDSCRPIGRDVEWDLDLQAPRRPEQVDTLIGLQLGRARERRLAALEVEHR